MYFKPISSQLNLNYLQFSKARLWLTPPKQHQSFRSGLHFETNTNSVHQHKTPVLCTDLVHVAGHDAVAAPEPGDVGCGRTGEANLQVHALSLWGGHVMQSLLEDWRSDSCKHTMVGVHQSNKCTHLFTVFPSLCHLLFSTPPLPISCLKNKCLPS